MKKITKIIIIVLIVILLSLAVCFSYKKIKVVREEKSREETTTVLGEDNYILNKNDGSKVNKSTKIIEDREVEGYKIENFDVIRNKETLTVGLDFVNDTEETKNERKASITFVDAQNNEIYLIIISLWKIFNWKS